MMMTDKNAMIDRGKAGYLDLTGAVTSSLCALHCALTPVLAASLPMIGLGAVGGEGAEKALLGTSVALATVGIGLGYRRHRSNRIVAVVAVGLALLAMGHLAETWGFETLGLAAVVAGGLTVAGSHLLNRRLCLSCPECRGVRSDCGATLASRLFHDAIPATSGSAGGAVSRPGEGPFDPGADRRSASLTSIR